MCRICAIATRYQRVSRDSSALLDTSQLSTVIQGDRNSLTTSDVPERASTLDQSHNRLPIGNN